jgi:nitrite reductase/ring-hydroxylating ferredoxin subunit/uncharacterized membrane protein
MASDITVKVINSQEWLEPIADRLQPAVASTLDQGGAIGPEAAKFLHGTWMGHPLHVVLTDVPIGSWTAAAILDLLDENLGGRSIGRAADAAIAVGVLGASAAAVTGLADWSKIGGGRPRRIGLVHGLLNATATVCYLASLCFRLGHARRTGRQLACLGYVISTVAAYLGGHLVYKEKLGVDHTADFSPPTDFVPVLADSELRDDQLRRVEVNGMPVLLVRKGAHIYAIAERCSHLGGPLSEGKLEGHAVRCPWHGSCFSLDDGRVLEGPSVHAQPILEVRVRDGQIEVRGANV